MLSLLNHEAGPEAEAVVEVELFRRLPDRNTVVATSIRRHRQPLQTWSIDGREVAQPELKKYMERLQIQPGNLCQFLPQDVVRYRYTHEWSGCRSSQGICASSYSRMLSGIGTHMYGAAADPARESVPVHTPGCCQVQVHTCMERLQIQPGNLCQFLPQDVVRYRYTHVWSGCRSSQGTCASSYPRM